MNDVSLYGTFEAEIVVTLKGGTMLQYRLPGMSRTTQDIDGLPW